MRHFFSKTRSNTAAPSSSGKVSSTATTRKAVLPLSATTIEGGDDDNTTAPNARLNGPTRALGTMSDPPPARHPFQAGGSDVGATGRWLPSLSNPRAGGNSGDGNSDAQSGNPHSGYQVTTSTAATVDQNDRVRSSSVAAGLSAQSGADKLGQFPQLHPSQRQGQVGGGAVAKGSTAATAEDCVHVQHSSNSSVPNGSGHDRAHAEPLGVVFDFDVSLSSSDELDVGAATDALRLTSLTSNGSRNTDANGNGSPNHVNPPGSANPSQLTNAPSTPATTSTATSVSSFKGNFIVINSGEGLENLLRRSEINRLRGDAMPSPPITTTDCAVLASSPTTAPPPQRGLPRFQFAFNEAGQLPDSLSGAQPPSVSTTATPPPKSNSNTRSGRSASSPEQPPAIPTFTGPSPMQSCSNAERRLPVFSKATADHAYEAATVGKSRGEPQAGAASALQPQAVNTAQAPCGSILTSPSHGRGRGGAGTADLSGENSIPVIEPGGDGGGTVPRPPVEECAEAVGAADAGGRNHPPNNSNSSYSESNIPSPSKAGVTPARRPRKPPEQFLRRDAGRRHANRGAVGGGGGDHGDVGGVSASDASFSAQPQEASSSMFTGRHIGAMQGPAGGGGAMVRAGGVPVMKTDSGHVITILDTTLAPSAATAAGVKSESETGTFLLTKPSPLKGLGAGAGGENRYPTNVYSSSTTGLGPNNLAWARVPAAGMGFDSSSGGAGRSRRASRVTFAPGADFDADASVRNPDLFVNSEEGIQFNEEDLNTAPAATTTASATAPSAAGNTERASSAVATAASAVPGPATSPPHVDAVASGGGSTGATAAGSASTGVTVPVMRVAVSTSEGGGTAYVVNSAELSSSGGGRRLVVPVDGEDGSDVSAINSTEARRWAKKLHIKVTTPVTATTVSGGGTDGKHGSTATPMTNSRLSENNLSEKSMTSYPKTSGTGSSGSSHREGSNGDRSSAKKGGLKDALGSLWGKKSRGSAKGK